MKLRRLILFITLLMTSCNQVSISSSDSVNNNQKETEFSYTTIDPSFSVRISDSDLSFRGEDIGHELNVNSSYSLFLDINDKESFPSPDDCRFEYDTNYLEIIDSVMDNYRSYPHYVWHLTPLKEVETTAIKVFYLNNVYLTYDISIKDYTVNASCSASIDKSLNSAYEYFPEKIKILKGLEAYEDYLAKYNYFNYIKNQPSKETFSNYEYAYIRIFRDDLGRDPELNSVFIKNGTLYFDFISTRNYFEEPRDVTMTTVQVYFLCLIRYPSGLNVSNYAIWNSVAYVEE